VTGKTVVPEEAVEAAARAMLVMFGPRSVKLEDLSAEDKAEELGAARLVLEAAAPFIAAKALEEAADDYRTSKANAWLWLRARAAAVRDEE
jgi:hypothetical protein